MYPLFKEDADGQPLGVFTTLITQSDIDMHLESVRIAPCLFQEVIPKQYELRINVIGNYVWSAAIYSQAEERTQLDYRHDIEGCVQAPVLIPPLLEAKCIDITRRLGLRMSNIDMIVTPDGDYVFLEANPNGQWLWVEKHVGFPLTHALIDELLGQDTLTHHPYIRDRSLHFHSEYHDLSLLREHGFD
jgi:glutathione synthase/RimK-type ligase-like ATP-grasp enzyme